MSQEKRSFIITFLAGILVLSVFVYKNTQSFLINMENNSVFYKSDSQKNSDRNEEEKSKKNATTSKSENAIDGDNDENKKEENTKQKEEITPVELNNFEDKDFSELKNDLAYAEELLNLIKNSLEEDNEEKENKSPILNFEEINRSVRKSLVNIICLTESGGPFMPISGSGIIISPTGVILTNAHIGQYFLLENYPKENFTNCTIRTGAPAKNTYKADLLYISNQWINENTDVITEREPTGTGKNDYAFLLIKEEISGEEISESLDYTIPIISTEHLKTGEDMLIAAYPSGFLGGIIIQKDLYPSSAVDKIEKLYTFEAGTLDLIEFKGNIIAQKGSSGGAVVDKRELLSGIIVTSTQEEQTGDRVIRAITLEHINRSLKKETGFNMKDLLESNLEETLKNLQKEYLPSLKEILIDSIEN